MLSVFVMRSALDIPENELDPHEQSFVANIRKYGWFRTYVFGEGNLPSFSYTTGLWITLGFPEIILFSLAKETAHTVLWDLYRDIQAGRVPPVRVRTPHIFAKLDAILVPCAKVHYPEHLGWSRWFYGGDNFDCVQLVWPDAEGRFPWEPDFNERFRNDQPDLTENGWVRSLAQ